MAVDIQSALIGTIHALLSLLLISLNIVVFVVLHRTQEFKTLTYLIIKHMIFGCTVQLCSLFFGAVMTIFNTNFNGTLEKLLGACLQSGWFLYISASLALAVERSLIFLMTNRSTRTHCISYVLLFLSWLLAGSYFVVLNLPGFGFTYFQSKGAFSWFYDSREETSQLLSLVEICVDFTMLAGILILYVVTVVRIISRKHSLAPSSSTKAELRVLLVSVVSFCYEGTYLLWFFWGFVMITDQAYISVIATTLWIVECGFLSAVTIVLNSSVREKVVDMWWKKKTKVTPIVSFSR
ncbi:hypothetical protein QR680_018011 [Steinernema hermaphroditum]|uniref:7TM GPCR serpentine receptor class x (Srx) domain-containing protein n=1 Tax=Steinernema hermaphroditum TaxID=289476 RepID=A0AA39HIP8_9BILA|nr:hypothetical protein QR680_018011 [Steinernema hermaphroditum]